jgi:hypothetical protein
MKKLAYRVFIGVQHSWKLMVLIAAIAVFLLAAGAPNATIGIGK